MKKTSLPLALLMLLVAIFPLHGALAEEPLYFSAFSAENIRGEDVITEEIFAEAEITILNFWATWCPPCVEELPDLAKLSELTDGRAQVIGVLLDGITYENEQIARDQDAIDMMHTLLDACDAAFAVLLPEDPLLLGLASVITSVPTTFIVSADGELLNYIVGSRTASEWVKIVEEYAEAE